MIVKKTNIKTGSVKSLLAHLTKTTENYFVKLLEGDPESLLDAEAIHGRDKNVARQIIVNPDQQLSPGQFEWMKNALKKEFGLGDRQLVIYEHLKERADGNQSSHYHILVPERDSSNQRLDSSHIFRRNEKIARLAEIEFGHKLTKGRHNWAVYNAFIAEGKFKQAEAMQELIKGPPALSKFSSQAHKIAKRYNVDLAAISFELSKINKSDTNALGKALAAIEKEDPRIKFEKGKNGKHLVMNINGEFISSMNRMLKVKAEENNQILFSKNQTNNISKGSISYDKKLENRDRSNPATGGSIGRLGDGHQSNGRVAGTPPSSGSNQRTASGSGVEQNHSSPGTAPGGSLRLVQRLKNQNFRNRLGVALKNKAAENERNGTPPINCNDIANYDNFEVGYFPAALDPADPNFSIKWAAQHKP